MSRLEQYRDIRITRKRYFIAIMIFFMLLIPGICIADYSVNSIMKDEKRIEFVSVKSINRNLIEVDVLNKKLVINAVYVVRDYERLKKTVMGWIKHP